MIVMSSGSQLSTLKLLSQRSQVSRIALWRCSQKVFCLHICLFVGQVISPHNLWSKLWWLWSTCVFKWSQVVRKWYEWKSGIHKGCFWFVLRCHAERWEAEFKYWARPVELWICEYWAFCKSKFVVLLGFGMYYDSYEAKKKLSWQCQDFENIVCSIPLWRCVLILRADRERLVCEDWRCQWHVDATQQPPVALRLRWNKEVFFRSVAPWKAFVIVRSKNVWSFCSAL